MVSIRRIVAQAQQSPRIAIVVATMSLGLISCTYAPRSQTGNLALEQGWQGASQARGLSAPDRHPAPIRRIVAPEKERRPVPPKARVTHTEGRLQAGEGRGADDPRRGDDRR